MYFYLLNLTSWSPPLLSGGLLLFPPHVGILHTHGPGSPCFLVKVHLPLWYQLSPPCAGFPAPVSSFDCCSPQIQTARGDSYIMCYYGLHLSVTKPNCSECHGPAIPLHSESVMFPLAERNLPGGVMSDSSFSINSQYSCHQSGHDFHSLRCSFCPYVK